MRSLPFLTCLLAIGCGGDSVKKSVPVDTATTPPPTVANVPALIEPTATGNPDGEDWPRFLGPLGTSVSPEKGIHAPWPKEGLRLVWEKPLGTGYGAPAVSRGRLFVFDHIDGNARLRCLDRGTGAPVWQFSYASQYVDKYGYDNGPRSCPVVDGDRVYILGVEGMLHCLRFADGGVLWKLNTQEKFGVRQNFFGVGSTPIVEGGLLIALIGGNPAGSGDISSGDLKGNGSGVVAFDKMTGDVKWQASDELASYSSPTLATIVGRRWCFVFARGGLVALNPADGKVDFHFPWRARLLESVNASNPVVVGDRVLLTECYGPGSVLLKVKPGGCKTLWSDADKGRDKSLRCHWNTPIYHDGFVYGSSGRHSDEARLRCVELATGKVMWEEPRLGRSSLLMADGHFICLTEFGELLLLKVNSKKYEEVSRCSVIDPQRPKTGLSRNPYWAAPVLSHGLLYVRGQQRLACLELIPRKAPN